MYPLYALAVAALSWAKWLLTRRAGRLEGRYTAAAHQADALAAELQTRPGNGPRPDVLTNARRQYELGRVVQARDRLEGKYVAWQTRADRAARLKARLTRWEGRTVPYLLGAADVVLVLALLGQAGLPLGLTGQNVDDAVRLYAGR